MARGNTNHRRHIRVLYMGPLVTWYHRPGASDVVGSSALILPRMADCIRLWWSDRRRAAERVDKKRPIVSENAARLCSSALVLPRMAVRYLSMKMKDTYREIGGAADKWLDDSPLHRLVRRDPSMEGTVVRLTGVGDSFRWSWRWFGRRCKSLSTSTNSF